MSEKDWNKILTESYMTMEYVQNSNSYDYRKCRTEIANPDVNWTRSWLLCRQKHLPPDLSSFLWKLMLNLFCTQEKLFSMRLATSPVCQLCDTISVDTLKHTYFHSVFSSFSSICRFYTLISSFNFLHHFCMNIHFKPFLTSQWQKLSEYGFKKHFELWKGVKN